MTAPDQCGCPASARFWQMWEQADAIKINGQARHSIATIENHFRRIMRSATFALSAALICLALAGCETGRANKMHASFESVSDIATTPHPSAQYASVSTGIPPVPGSPTAAGPDGLQPFNDGEARKSPGSEKGIPMAPHAQPQDKFVRQ
jgi:hypothetical protein